MSPSTCPNTKCKYDKQLQPGQRCPLCGREAKEFKFGEFGNLLKEKADFKKSVETTKEDGQVVAGMKFCPKCGSTNISFPTFYRPSIWRCLDCGYEGALIVKNGKLAEKIQQDYRKTRA
jgi:DNA-directed RNA polymerase subunit M